MDSSSRVQAASVAQMGGWEKATVLPNVFYALGRTLAEVFLGVFKSSNVRAASYYRHVKFQQIRAFTDALSPRQLHVVSPPTGKAYEKVCQRHGQKLDSISLEDGTVAYWIGQSTAEKVIINFHGGGYVIPASEFMFEFMFRLQKLISQDGKDVAILFLAYDLAPQAPYPRQLQQAAALLKHTVTTLNKKPSNIVLTGDSAGGNLVMALLSHLSHPHKTPSMIPEIKLESKLRGAVLISPWVSFNKDYDSWTRNAQKDLISIVTGGKWSEAFMGTVAPHTENSDNWNDVSQAPNDWWKDVMAEELLFVAGKDEVMVDGIVEFTERLIKLIGKDKVTLFVAEGEAHDAPSLDLQLGYEEPGAQAKLIRRWISSRL